CADHCDPFSRIETDVDKAYQTIEGLKDPDVDINLDEVMAELLDEGIDKFIKPFDSLMDSLDSKVKQIAA
ncbi:MAG: transaldolase, partial [Spirulinaceae cyanobacterium]